MEVILLEKVGKLGELGDRVNVRSGYGRNYLIPFGKAVAATDGNIAEFEQRRTELEQVSAERRANADARAARLNGLSVTISANAGEEGKLFGSIGTRDIAEAVTAAGVEIQKSEVRLPLGAIRVTGEYEIDIQVHSDVTQAINVSVVAG